MVGISKFPRKWTTSRDWEKFLKQDSRNTMSYSIFEWNFGNLLLNGTILQFVKPRKKKPGFRYNLPLSYSQKKKKKTSFFFNKRLRTIRLQLLMLKKKKTLSDTNYEGKKMYRNRKQHDICGKITRQRWLQIRALLSWGTRSIWHPWLSNWKNSVRKLAT